MRPAVKREAGEDWGRESMATPLILKRAPIGDNQDDYDVLENGVLCGRWSELVTSLIWPMR